MARKVLAIDTACDPLSRASYTFRKANVLPRIAARGFEVVSLCAARATFDGVAQVMADTDIAFITASGHGAVDAFYGYGLNNASIFETGQRYPGSVAGTIAHLLSCGSAYRLGHDFIQRGCVAFVGYDADFVYLPEKADVFFECDGLFDVALAEGCTVGDAVQRARQRYQERMHETGDSAIGGRLAFDLAHLTSPLSDANGWWGKAEVTL